MDFSRKARFVAGGHMTEASASMTYASLVSRDSVRLGFLIAKLNELALLSCDIGNAYLNAPCREKIWFQAGKECGSDEGKAMVLCRALYGLKSVGASWRAMFSGSIKDLGFNSTMIDPDVYIRKNFRNDSTPYYEMILVYVDDVLCISNEPKGVMEALGEMYELKGGSVCEPTLYLGANIQEVQLANGRESWSMSSDQYVNASIGTVNELLYEEGRELQSGKRQGKTPLPHGYHPEVDVSTELTVEKWSHYMQLIGILRWAVELGRIDIERLCRNTQLHRERDIWKQCITSFSIYRSTRSQD
jgi:Reverse transcriptase (RNA-dependent DNA polymerase)